MENNPQPQATHGTSSVGSPTAGDFPPSLPPRTPSTSWAPDVASPPSSPRSTHGSSHGSTLSRPPILTRNERAQTLSFRSSYGTGKRVFYMTGEVARIVDTDDTDEVHTYYTIEVNGSHLYDVHRTDLSTVHPTVNKVLDVLNLHDETDQYLKKNYPTLKEFENFLNLSSEAVKTFHKINGELKEPRFKRSDREEFIILRRWWAEEKKKQDNLTVNWEQQYDGKVNWGHFNEENINDLREKAPKEDLSKVLEELGINKPKVVDTLKAKGVQSPAHFVQKTKSWYDKLNEEPDVDESLLLKGPEKIAIEKFKQWYLFHSIGYLPSDWIVSFRNDDVHPKERDLRKVLRVIGVNADAIEALKMNDIKDVPTLNRTSKEWRTESARGLSSIADRIPWIRGGEQESRTIATEGGRGLPSVADRNPPVGGGEYESRSNATEIGRGSFTMADKIPTIGGEQESRSNEWKDMGLTRNDAREIISFRHWYNLYIAGKLNMKGWTAEFNSAQYNNFLQRFEPGDNFRTPFWWKFKRHDRFMFSRESHDYYDMLQKAAESGYVTDVQRYHLMKYYKEDKEKMCLIEEITSHHHDGLGDSAQQEKRLQEMLAKDEEKADEKDKGDLLFGQEFCQFFFSAFLVLVLLASWFGTTVYFMLQFLWEKEYLAKGGEPEKYDKHAGFEYVTFINNVLFGLVTAVVIQELGEEASETSLYYRFLPTYRKQRRRQKEYQILNRIATRDFKGRVMRYWGNIVQFTKTYLMMIILWSTRLYIMCWIFLGAVSLAFGAIAGVDTSNPLYTTGQTWLGIAVTIGYTYFGLSGKNAPKLEDDGDDDDNDEGNKSAAIQGTHDGSGGTNGRKEAGISDEREDEKKSGDNTHQERIHTTIDHYNKDADALGTNAGIDDMTGAGESPTHETGDPALVKFETVEMMTEEGRKSFPGYRKEGSSQQKSQSQLRGNELELADGYVPARILPARILNVQRGDRLDPDYSTNSPKAIASVRKVVISMINTSSTSPSAADLTKPKNLG
eukprot:CAMPEP_0113391290 /NCGR_PEP_ID=MMETSP0013_2-20120614/10630_1 /TAXON_ID=2843 ORGANISM="Skeletonema costatum, Strain 1716" /NCGR_SAMPLE_ID=MMETSP0013_2 /ASSEMBLY_ACC=CAM_ASM_000158 /LENGTH=1015 /DNA_ID=CAMNT_0000274521 /DNA_START=75 /DNA_END=3123 /DNA_ORIENTATION=- /assembly_acc=CAM_ASM_000158